MEKCFEGIAILVALDVGIFITVIFINLAINVIPICWVIGSKLEQYVGEKIDKQIYHKQKQLWKEIDGD